MKRDELKTEIASVLDFCECYTYTSEGLDMWLDAWWEGCGKQITEIAEKSPYYNGNYQIVFPAEYPREINPRTIKEFGQWVYRTIPDHLTPYSCHGFTIDEISAIRSRLNQKLDMMIEYDFDSYKGFTYGQIREDYDRFNKYLNEVIRENKYMNWDGSYYEKCDYADKAWNLQMLIDHIKEQFLDDRLAQFIRNQFPNVNASAGQKASRAVRNIAVKLGTATHPEWEREFARFADAINPLNVTKWTVLSWHPVDYLTSAWGNSWSSCMNIDKYNKRGVKIANSRSHITDYVNEDYVFRGEHASGTLSYMFDHTSFVYYTVNHKYDGNQFELQPKESRCMFSFQDNTLLQSRMYPQCLDDTSDTSYRIPREIVQKVIADALDVPNLWTLKMGTEACCEYGRSIGTHYPDYTDRRNKMCNISYLGDEPHIINIGSEPICPNCGCTHDNAAYLNCEDC